MEYLFIYHNLIIIILLTIRDPYLRNDLAMVFLEFLKN